MKKLFAILMMICYLIPSIGIKVNQHFCGKHLASTTFGETQNPPCGCGNKSMKKDCCKDVKSFVKINDTQENTPQCTFAISTLDLQIYIPQIWELKAKKLFVETRKEDFVFHPPPPNTLSLALYIQHQALLI